MKYHFFFRKIHEIITVRDVHKVFASRPAIRVRYLRVRLTLWLVVWLVASVGALAGCSSDPLRLTVERSGPSTPSASGAESPAVAQVVAQDVVGPGAVESKATVTKISDGDTVTVQFTSGATEKVRFIGVDTPETKRPNTPIQCFGPEATQFTTALIPIGTKVRVERDVETRDRYGRLLGYVYRASDGLFVNEALTANGYANLLTYPPNVAHVDEFRDAVTEARDANRGLWQACPATVAP